jgi:circadian clock protein KaiB
VTDTEAGDGWALTLYVNGASPKSIHAIETVRRVCDEESGLRIDLEVVDVQDDPAIVVRRDQIIVVPTLIKRLPFPLRRIVRDLSDPVGLRHGLDLGPDQVGRIDPEV